MKWWICATKILASVINCAPNLEQFPPPLPSTILVCVWPKTYSQPCIRINFFLSQTCWAGPISLVRYESPTYLTFILPKKCKVKLLDGETATTYVAAGIIIALLKEDLHYARVTMAHFITLTMVKDLPKIWVLELISTSVGFLSTLIANIYQKLDESYKTL